MSKYRERVYCYELYHRWRSHWPNEFQFSLCGEIDKADHPIIRGNHKPDFLVHVPGEMTNLLIVEVKPANAGIGGMTKDLKTLTKYCRDLGDSAINYRAAYFWVYGIMESDWPRLRARLIRRISNDEEIDRNLISCFVHERPGAQAIPVSWADDQESTT